VTSRKTGKGKIDSLSPLTSEREDEQPYPALLFLVRSNYSQPTDSIYHSLGKFKGYNTDVAS
jgi:hypothetical protein